MPYSFTQIEENKSNIIRMVFVFLIFFYVMVVWLVAFLVLNSSMFSGDSYYAGNVRFSSLSLFDTFLLFGLAFGIGYVHWNYTTSHMIRRISGVLKAEPLKSDDHYHQMFRNIIEEVSVATGGRKMEGVVVPTMAMNAFAVSDFSGRAVIGVTEGMLARLTRAQLEAVVGHEAAHIVSGDSLATSVITSLFELFSGALRGLELVLRGSSSRSVRGSSRGGGGVGLILVIYALLALTQFLGSLLHLFISRQREYRADAMAVRLTRDPLSLAEALYAISFRWRGAGLAGQELASIFIVNPVFSALDESEGMFAEMFSTHPPVKSRLAILLEMAHTDAETLAENVENKMVRPRTMAPEAGASSAQWMANQGGVWQGPFNLTEMSNGGWLKPETWITRVGDNTVKAAYEDEMLMPFFRRAGAGGDSQGSYACPKGHGPLDVITYEGAQVHKCGLCRGTLVAENDIHRIIIRQEVGFSDKVKRIAEGIQKNGAMMTWKMIDRNPQTLFSCPRCRHARERMMRTFFTDAYRVEVDKCFACGLVWFDADELEVLQYLIEYNLEKNL